MAVAQLSSQVVALPRREAVVSPGLDALRIAAWLPLLGILAGLIGLFYLALTSEVTTTGYGIQQLQAEESYWKLRNEQLRLELSRARSLAAVEAEASARLRMVRPNEIVYLRVPAPDPTPRMTPSSRGEARNSPALAEPEARPADDRLGPVRESLSSLLAPRLQPQPPRR